MKYVVWVLFAPAIVLTPSIVHAAPGDAEARAAREVLFKNCVGCHGGGRNTKGGFGFVLDRDRMVARQLVVPGKADASDLYLRVAQGEMPPQKNARLSPADQKILKEWIDAGAPAFERAPASARVVSPSEATTYVLADLQQLDPRQRRFMRYLTLAHLVRAGRSEAELQTVREAVGKLLNCLSWHPRITRPEAIDPDATILRIDLRAYKWNAALWARLASAYPYRLQTASDSQALAKYAESEDAALRADWFIATAARPPFYHDLLQLPTSDRALERLLQVDVPGDLQDDNVIRAGFNDSGVSRNNRLIERHDAAHGSYWRSYDFANNTGRQNLFEHPRGPNTGATSFQPAGGEVIFHLPNGLQGYMLVDVLGRRIDKAPSEIVADPRRPDQRVETGISCMSCHARGLLPKADQLRAHVDKNAAIFAKAVVDAVRALHPRPPQFQAQVAQDNVRYLKALEPFGVRDADQEPINLVTQRFETTLDGPTAAAELGITILELGLLLKQNPEQARLFGTLLVGGTAQRELFQANFPELARRLLAMQASQPAKVRPLVQAAFQGHSGTINAIAFAPDSQRVATGSDDRTVRIWDVGDGKSLGCLTSSAEVYAVAFSADGTLLLSAGSDRLVRLWDVRAGSELRTLRGHTAPVRCVAFAPDGKLAVSGGDDRSLRIWDLSSGQETATLAGHTGALTAVAWSHDGRHILSSGRDGAVRWWSAASAKEVRCLDGHTGPVLSIALADDGKSALSGGNDKTVRLWSMKEGKELHCFTGHTNAVVAVQFRGGREFSSAGSQHQNAEPTSRRWDLIDRRQIGAMPVIEELRFGCAAFSPDGKHVLVGGPGGFLRLVSW
jgi:mono/diheme cytochrome c family protein